MKKFDELLEKLKGLDVAQTGGCWEEEIPEEIWEEYLLEDNLKEVDSGLDVDKHRWYEISTTVYEIFGRYLGVRMATDLFSEQMGYSDCSVTIEFFEMKLIQTITYQAI